MSTATINTAAPCPPSASPTRAILRRFMWKEYRTLRGLWFAVFVLGIIEQAVSALVAAPGTDLPVWLFGSALAATVLYAVGASAVLFSVEHEEETYGFLSGLPATWQPVLAGKLFVATTSALALAAALTLFGAAFAGWFYPGPKLPSAAETSQLLGIFGLAIFEALAWGTFFSLLVKRPLVAAVLTIVVGATFVHLAVGISNQSSLASSDLQAYSHAIPMRLAILVGLFALNLLAARNWLAPRLDRAKARGALGLFHSERAPGSTERSPTVLDLILAPLVALIDGLRWTASTDALYSRTRMLVRLLWQTWRDSWKMLFVPILVAAFLLVGVSAAIWFLFGENKSAIFAAATLFFAPALYGALAFRADQRRRHYRFLAEHAARPRYVWLSRHLVALGALLVLLLALTLGFISTAIFGIRHNAQELLANQWQYQSPGITVPELWSFTSIFLAGSALTWLGALAAYAVGQFFSMLFRSEILAAFISLVLSTLLTAWAGVIFAWQLDSWLFLLPIGLGFLGATWLRAPAWIADRQSLRAWLPPLLAIVTPFALIAATLPQARLAQLPVSSDEAVTLLIEHSELLSPAPTPEAKKTAAMYADAVAMFDSWRTSGLLDRWNKPEYAEPIGGYGMGGMAGDAMMGMGAEATTTNQADPAISTFGIDASKIPLDELEAFQQAAAELEKLQIETQSRAIALLVEASQRPTCFFDVNWSGIQIGDNYANAEQMRHGWEGADPMYRQVVDFVSVVAESGDTPESAIEHQIAALRMCDHLREGQPTGVATMILELERHVLNRIADWAAGDIPSQGNRRTLLEKLEAHFQTRTNPASAFLADRELVNSAITGKSLPLALSETTSAVHLAYLANRLPWERERGLRAVDLITARNIEKTTNLFYFLSDQTERLYGQMHLFEYTSPEFLARQIDPWTLMNPAVATSYFAVMEYDARVRAHQFYRGLCDTETVRRATLIRIALAMYRADHDTYPAALSELVPKYLTEVPNDLYANGAFNYSPRGLDLPLLVNRFSDYRRISADTPLFWSVGHENSRLVRQVMNVPSASAPDDGKTETLYILMNEDQPWYVNREPALVFPLRK